MITIGINTALANAQVSILKDDKIIASLIDERPFSQATSITGLIETAIQKAGINFNDIDIIACAIGPGSFTGIRIGIAAAKGMEISLKKPLIGIDIFETVAQNYNNKAISVLIDSRRKDFFCQEFQNGKRLGEPWTIASHNIDTLKNKTIFAENEQNLSDNICYLAVEKYKNNEHCPAIPMYIRDADVTICKK